MRRAQNDGEVAVQRSFLYGFKVAAPSGQILLMQNLGLCTRNWHKGAPMCLVIDPGRVQKKIPGPLFI